MVLWLCVCVCVCVILLILDIKLMASNETSVDMSLNISLKFPSDANLVMTCEEVTLEQLFVCCVLIDFWGVGENVQHLWGNFIFIQNEIRTCKVCIYIVFITKEPQELILIKFDRQINLNKNGRLSVYQQWYAHHHLKRTVLASPTI
jgi:hypothetical protein